MEEDFLELSSNSLELDFYLVICLVWDWTTDMGIIGLAETASVVLEDMRERRTLDTAASLVLWVMASWLAEMKESSHNH